MSPRNPAPFPPLSTPVLRRASAADQPRITRIVRAAGIFPFDLKWQRFIVAEDEGVVVGAVQLKEHLFGARELASLVVIPERRNAGIAGHLIRALLEETHTSVYLTCHISLEFFYEHFGFRRLSWREMPSDFKRISLFLWLVTPFGWLVTRGNFKILVMGREYTDVQ